jgi:hypothetical protein
MHRGEGAYYFLSIGSDIDSTVGTADVGAEPFIDTLSVEEVATLPNGAHLFVLKHLVLANYTVFGRGGLKASDDRIGTNVVIGGGDYDGLHQIVVEIVIEEGSHNVREAGRVKGSVEQGTPELSSRGKENGHLIISATKRGE